MTPTGGQLCYTDAYARTADPALLTAATHCAELIGGG